MTFLNLGLFVAGAAAVSIPIIIHFLFRRRRKPIVWAAMRFIIEAYKKHQRRLKLEQWLLLATRCLLLLLIALALGRPVAQSATAALGYGGGRTVYFVIDNSLTSSARAPGAETVSALDRQKQIATRLISSMGPGDQAALVTLASPAQAVVSPPSADIAAVQSLINDLQPTAARADFAGAFSALAREMRDLSARDARRVVVVLSEFRAGSADVSRPLDATLSDVARLRLTAARPAESALGNVQVADVEPLRRLVLASDAAGAGAVDVRVRLRRTGAAIGEAGTSSVRLTLERPGEESAPSAAGTVRWRAGQSEAEIVLTAPVTRFEDTATAALVARIDRDAIESDNVFARPVEVRSAVRVGVAARRRFGAMPSADALQPADWLRLALAPSDADPIDVIDVDPGALDAPTLAGLDALVLPRPELVDEPAWRRIGDFARAGGLVFVTPPPDTAVHLWSDSFASALHVPWRLAREAVTYADGARIDAAASGAARSSIFEMIASELPELARSVTVVQALPLIEGAGAAGSHTLMTYDDGSPWLVVATPGEANGAGNGGADAEAPMARGLVVYLASAPTLSWTDLPARPLFVPLLQEIIRQGVGEATAGNVFVAGERAQPPARTVELAPLNSDAPAARHAVASTGLTAPIRTVGLWRALDRQGVARGLIAVNADAHAGRTEVQAPANVRDWLLGAGVSADDFAWIDTDVATEVGAIAQSADEGGWLSYPLLIAAAVTALIELLLARVFSHAAPHAEKASIAGAAA